MTEMRVDGQRAYCKRAGCDRVLGTIETRADRIFVVRLQHTPREGWVNDLNAWELRRRRHASPSTVDVQLSESAARAEPGDMIVCPKCRTRQLVPLSPS
jgi:hypothetical protein